MRRLTLSCVLLTAITGPATAEVPEPLDVIGKAIKAQGGKEALVKNWPTRIQATGTMLVPAKSDYTATFYFGRSPNRFRAEYQLTAGGQTVDMLQVYDGKKFWMKLENGAAIDMGENFAASSRDYLEVMAAAQLLPLLDKEKFSLSPAGEFEVKDRKTFGVNVSNKAGLNAKFCFDPKTHLIVRQDYGSKNPFTGKEVLVEYFPGDYKKIKDVLLPMRWEGHFDGKKIMTAKYESVEFDKVDASLFKKPE